MTMIVSKMKSLAVIASLVATGTVSLTAEAGTVSTDGSTSMEKVIGILSESFTKANPSIRVTYSPTGSGAGIAAAREGRCDIGLSSRGLKTAEKAELNETVIALDGIVIVVNKSNTVKNLTLDEIHDIYTGKITRWKQLGGADRPIVLIGREAGSGTRDGFESVTKTKDSCKYRQELTSTGDVLTTVAKNKNAIGYASLSAANKKVKVLTVNGVAANEVTVQNQSYKLQRPFVFATKKGTKQSADFDTFYKYATSKDVAPLLRKAGVVPVK